jgi:hypothetical protein
MKLIKELQDNVVDAHVSLSTTLRKAKVLASLLKHEHFKAWVNSELNGYEDGSSVPEYRSFSTQNYGIFNNGFQVVKNAPIPIYNLPETVKTFAGQIEFRQGVRQLESMAESKEQVLHFKWPAEAIMLVQHEFNEGYVLIDAWRVVGRSQIEGSLDAIRNKLLEFILQLKEIRPEIIESEDAISQIPEDKIANIFKITIQGDHNVLATGTGVSQEVHQHIVTNDAKTLADAMRKMNVSSKDIEELTNAIKADGSRKKKNIGEGVRQWLGNMTGKAMEGAWKVAVDTAPGLLTKAISKYYGWE